MIKKTTLMLVIILISLVACKAPASFSLNPSKTKLELDQNSTVSFTLGLSGSVSTTSTLALSISGLPEGVTETIDNSAKKISLSSSSNAEAGKHTLTVTGTIDDKSAETQLNLEVFAQPFTLLSTPSTISLEQGESAALRIEVARDAFDGVIDISLKNPIIGLGAEALSLQANESSGILTLNASPNAPTTASPTTIELEAMSTTSSARASSQIQVSITPKTNIPTLELSVSPLSLKLGKNKPRSLEVIVQRKGGFVGPVTVRAEGLPEEIKAPNITIAANDDSGTLELTADPLATVTETPLSFTIIASGNVNNEPVVSKSNPVVKLSVVESLSIDVATIASGLEVPWDIEFSPDGTLYFTERNGNTKRIKDGVVQNLTNPFTSFSPAREPGLMGLQFDPDFTTNNFLYICYTYNEGGLPKNRVSRLTLNESALALEAEKTIIDAIPGGDSHNGCRLAFDKDGLLYVTTGDADESGGVFSQDVSNLAGKVLRVNTDGSIPSGNPTSADDPKFGAEPSLVWAYGLRNSQGLVFHPNGFLYGTEHGTTQNDEINLLEEANNYGWPIAEGTEIVDGSVAALLTYTPTIAPAGMTYYTGSVFPEWEGDLLFVALKNPNGKQRQLVRLELSEDGRSIVNEEVIFSDTEGFLDSSNLTGRFRDVEVGPDGKIYIATSNKESFGDGSADKILVLSQ